jgi:hypothetical protein
MRENYRPAEVIGEDLPLPAANTMAGEAMMLARSKPGLWVRTGHTNASTMKQLRNKYTEYEWESRGNRIYVRWLADMPESER